ncbi:hypothetical protein XENOCAPTIV_011419 [Xenoophorus captivus]|uniref:Secreted protein n=1 Tax=Xenoophorus captivus TaxID=1517983 RepID=A0ABV0R0T7_9TELE
MCMLLCVYYFSFSRLCFYLCLCASFELRRLTPVDTCSSLISRRNQDSQLNAGTQVSMATTKIYFFFNRGQLEISTLKNIVIIGGFILNRVMLSVFAVVYCCLHK